jgi:hypothetical protein
MVYGILRDKERLDAGETTEIAVTYTWHEVSGVDALAQLCLRRCCKNELRLMLLRPTAARQNAKSRDPRDPRTYMLLIRQSSHLYACSTPVCNKTIASILATLRQIYDEGRLINGLDPRHYRSLSDSRPNLENALIKTKILLHRFGEKTLGEWINKELHGYTSDDQVPAYMIIRSEVKMTISDGFPRPWNNVPAPMSHLTDEIQSSLERTELLRVFRR